jgi:hypothetical protein
MSYSVEIQPSQLVPGITVDALIKTGHIGFIDGNGQLYLICKNGVVDTKNLCTISDLSRSFCVKEFCSISIRGYV